MNRDRRGGGVIPRQIDVKIISYVLWTIWGFYLNLFDLFSFNTKYHSYRMEFPLKGKEGKFVQWTTVKSITMGTDAGYIVFAD